MAREIRYEGDVITDVTSFSMVQNIFDGKKEVTRSQIESLDAIIQLLVFYDSIWVVKPALFGKEVPIASQEVLNTLIRDGVIHELPELPADFAGDPETQFREIQEIIAPSSIEEYYESHCAIAEDLSIYNENFDVSRNPKAMEFAERACLDQKYLPLCSNLLRANGYLRTIRRIRQEQGKVVTYTPNILRTSLVSDIVSHRDDSIHRILQDQIASIESPVKERRQNLAERAHCNFDLELPLLTAIIVDQCRDRDDFLDEVLAWRRDSSAVKVRGWLREFQGDICNKRLDHVGRHFDRLDSFSKSIGAKSSTKAKLVTCLTDPSLIGGVLTANPVPAAAMAAHSVGRNLLLPFVNSLMNRDLFLFMKMKEKGEVISFEKEKFEEIFDVRIRV